MKVLLTGLPYFAHRSARYLTEYSPASDRFIPVDLKTGRGQARFLLEVPSADAVFCHWGTLIRSRALELAFRLRKRVVQFWMGTDVLDALEVAESGAAYPPYIHDCVHVCEGPWTRDELATIGVRAEVAPLAPMTSIAPDASEISAPASFSVLGYVGRDREDFYGLPQYIRLAEDFADVPFTIAGIDSAPVALPPNLQLLGWTDEEFRLYRDCAAYVRIPEHDGYSYSVREALTWGRHVVTSYPYPHCLYASDYESLRAHVDTLKTRFDGGGLDPNLEGRDFVLREFDNGTVVRGLRRTLSGAPS
jgi:hypothetical protein